MSVFDRNFCEHLEYQLSATFRNTSVDKFNILWCDGAHIPDDENQLEKQNILRNKKIITKAHIGLDGQDLYEMTIIFGALSLKNYANDISLIDCLPGNQSSNWISINTNLKTISIRLN